MRITLSAIVLTALLAGTEIAPAQEGLRAGIKAPDFSLPTIKEEVVSLKDAVARGTVILHFWKSK